MASGVFDEGAEARRPTVQVGDPFREKLLIEACLELMEGDDLIAVQDMGAAGLTCATAEMAADDAAIQTAETQLEYATITAPSDGRIGVRLVDPGNIVHANDQASLATLVLTRPSAVLFTLPARALDDKLRADALANRGAAEQM